MKLPKIRFKGRNSRTEKFIKQIWKISTGKSNTQDQTEDWKYPFFIRSDIVVKSNKFLFNEEAVITIGDWNIWKVFHYINGKYDLHQRCYKISDFKDIFWKYFYYYFSTKFYKRAMSMTAKATVDSVRLEMISDMLIRFPSLPEQEKIRSLFEQLDSQITKNQQKLEKLKNMKQSFLQKLFPKDWSALPELRFKGFEGAWEERKLGELFEERHEVSTITEDYPQLSFSIAEWVIKPEDRKTNKRDFLIIDKTNKKYLKTELDDIIYNPSNIVFWAIHRNWLCKWVVSPIYKIFSTQQDSIFMDSLVTRKIFINETKKFLEWTVTKLRSLKPEAFLNIKVLISSEIKEQRRIWQLFNVIDKQIKLYEPQIQKLQNLKQSLLEKMFI